jgi:hypothetical protein
MNMHQGWVIDVLADLKTFARQNDLPALAGQLEESILVAAAELAQPARQRRGVTGLHDAKARNDTLQPAVGEGT